MVGSNYIDGSPQWQIAIFLIAGACIVVNALRGWSTGLMHQVIGIIALFAACYSVLTFTARMEEFLAPHLPAPILPAVSMVLIWIISFNAITLVGRLFFKRTRDYDSDLFRVIYGLGGALIGAACGFLIVLLFCATIRIVGRVATNQVEVQAARNQNSPTIALNLAKLNNSMELGPVGTLFRALDPIPRSWYRQLDQYSRISLDSESMQRLVESAAIRRISQNPRILDIERDPSIMEAVQRGDLLNLLTNPKVITLLGDPEIRRVLDQRDVSQGLDPDQTEHETASGRQ